MATFSNLADSFRSAGASAPRIDPTTAAANPRTTQAALTRAQWDLYEQTAQKGEDALLNFAQDKTQPGVYADLARQDVNRAYDLSEGMAERRLSRFGLQMDPEQRAVSERLRGLGRGLALAGAENDARRDVSDLQMDTLGHAMGMGRGTSNAASESLNAAVGLQGARENLARQIEQQDQAISAQKKSSGISTMLGIAGIAASFI